MEQAKEATLFSNRQVAASEDAWRRRLGHCALQTLQKLQKDGLITLNNKHKDTFLRRSCEIAKLYKLPFVSFSHKTLVMFERIHCHLWGLAPVQYVKDFQYHTLFVDDFSYFSWFSPL